MLVDTEPLFLRACRDALARFGVEVSEAEYRRISLIQGRSLFELAKDRGVSDEDIRDARAWRDDRYSELINEGVTILDGVDETLAGLHGQAPMAVVTSSDPEHFDLIHVQTGLMRYFDFALRNDEYEQSKPHPEPYLTAAARLGVDPSRCLAVEDTARGLQSALAAGMRCVVIPHALSLQSNFEGAHRVATNVREVARAFESLRAA